MNKNTNSPKQNTNFAFFIISCSVMFVLILISIPPPSAGGTNSNESIDLPPHCYYNKSEKLYYKARGGES